MCIARSVAVNAVGVTSLLWAGIACAQGTPTFRADRVLSAMDNRITPLIRGRLMSIYGESLGPATSCVGQPDLHLRETVSPLLQDTNFVNLLVYPSELCETQVLIEGQAAGCCM